jgi:glycine/D-amino acid oxidase-like deaminating enzyme
MTGHGPKVAVVGAGIVGASIAWHLARRGAAVTLIDRGRPAGGVTRRAFGWIGRPLFPGELRHLAVHEWHRLDRAIGERLKIDWCGCLTWTDDPTDAERMVRDAAGSGEEVSLMERAAVARREPNLVEPPRCAVFAPGDASIDAGETTRVIAEAAASEGAILHTDSTVTGIVIDGGRVTGLDIAEGTIEADVVVLAAGTASRALAQGVGVPLGLDPSPAVRIDFRAPRRLVHTIITCPVAELRDGGPGALVAAEDFEADVDALARRTLEAVHGFLRGAGDLALVRAEAGQRPMPADEKPILGFAPQIAGLYVAAMHSAVTLAPLAGRLAATEILNEVEVSALAPYRPARFA